MVKFGAPLQERCKRGHLMAETRKHHPNGDAYCSACKQARHDQWYTKPGSREKQREYRAKANLKRLYGITLDDYQVLLDEQGGVCAICKRTRGIRKLHVDHDHDTGIVRGLLCHACNTALGLLGEDPAILSAALEYLALSKADSDVGP